MNETECLLVKVLDHQDHTTLNKSRLRGTKQFIELHNINETKRIEEVRNIIELNFFELIYMDIIITYFTARNWRSYRLLDKLQKWFEKF